MRPKIITGILIILFIVAAAYFYQKSSEKEKSIDLNESPVSAKTIPVKEWVAPDTSSIPRTEEGELIRYGHKLIIQTSEYLGPKGSVATISNGMNCQNCHLNAGTKSFSNNFASVSSGYPRYRPRSNRIESIEFRVNDCMQRSLNGQPIDSLSKEMRAYVAYFKWIGKDVTKEADIQDGGVERLPLLSRAADPDTGKVLYLKKCKICHGSSGQGLLRHDSAAYVYPPLWGPNSYNTGAGMHRLTRLAGFIKNNMPFGTTYQNPQLTDEEAWDIAAYITSQPRPAYKVDSDWPNIATKPFDYPFGPYKNQFSEKQHQYGPFEPIKQANEKLNK